MNDLFIIWATWVLGCLAIWLISMAISKAIDNGKPDKEIKECIDNYQSIESRLGQASKPTVLEVKKDVDYVKFFSPYHLYDVPYHLGPYYLNEFPEGEDDINEYIRRALPPVVKTCQWCGVERTLPGPCKHCGAPY